MSSDKLPDVKNYRFNSDDYYYLDWKVAAGLKDGDLITPPKSKEQQP